MNKSGMVLVLVSIVAVLAGSAGYVLGGALSKIDPRASGTIMSAELYQAERASREATKHKALVTDGRAAPERIRADTMQWLASDPQNLAAIKSMTSEEFEQVRSLTPETLAQLNEQVASQGSLVGAITEPRSLEPAATE